MNTFDLEANMKKQAQFDTGALAITPSTPRQVLECGRGLPPYKPLSRWYQHLALLLLAWLGLPGTVLAQPADYADEAAVASYVKGLLYWPDADQAHQSTAAFRYKHLLYVNDGGIRPDLTNMANLYGNDERILAQTAEAALQGGLTNHPASLLLDNLLLDLYYDRAAAEAILAGQAVEQAQRAHFGPPIAAPASGFIIDNEIGAYCSALASNRYALATYCRLLTNDLGVADGNPIPLGYRLFQSLVPGRGLAPATYVVTNLGPVSVTGDTNALFTGYKDLVLLYGLLSDQGRTVTTLARLLYQRNGAGDLSQAQALITEAQRSLFLHLHTLRTAFPAFDPNDASLANSGLAGAMAKVGDSLDELEGLKQLQRSQLNPLGFDPDFLVFVQGTFGGEAPQDDTYDALLVHLGLADSELGLATTALATAQASYAQYRGFQDQLAAESDNSCITYYDRLRDLVGYFPDDPAYTSYPQGAPGSELDQQILSVQAAKLQIQRNQAEIANVTQQVQIELAKAESVSDVYVRYGDKQAKITEYVSYISAAQAAATEAANAVEKAGDLNAAGAGAHAANAVFQAACEVGKGLLEAQKERLAAAQSAEITGLEAQATVKTLLLQMNTLAVDSLSAALELRKQVNMLQALYREKAQLEANLEAGDQNLTSRYFADPVHRLAMQADMIAADQAFTDAQQWLFFMARALEYKWNAPFNNTYSGSVWTLDSLFKLRNADELTAMYQAMKDFDNLRSLYAIVDDRWDWLSLREDLLGYRRLGNTNEVLTYVDPISGETVDAITMFQRYLQRHTDSNGVITVEFSTVLENQNTFFRGPNSALGIPGQWLDKIDSMVIRLPGNHTTTNYSQWDTLAGALGYGGSSYVRNEWQGAAASGHPDRLVNEMTSYNSKWWYNTTNGWRFRDIRTNSVSMLKADPNVPRLTHDFPSDIPDRLATTALIINTFRERSVATSRWILRIPTLHPTIAGRELLRIGELDDVEIYFYHWSYERP